MSFYQTNHYQINSYPKNQNLYYDDFEDYESSANKKGNHIYSNYFIFGHLYNILVNIHINLYKYIQIYSN